MHNLQLLFFGLVSMCVAGRVHPRFKKRTETVIMGLGRNQQPLGPSPKPLQLIPPQRITYRIDGSLDGIGSTGPIGLVQLVALLGAGDEFAQGGEQAFDQF